MTAPLALRLDDGVRRTREDDARAREADAAARIRPTGMAIAEAQRARIRRPVALAIGLG
ncbi:MAG: hypothetical protein KGI51_04125 [Rhodospirillales bacterium]|nr:hypothetical protein [Rhodospirillales bacterium]